LAHQQTSNDYDKLKQEEAEKSARLQELMYVKSVKNTKLTNDLINTRLATPKKTATSNKTNMLNSNNLKKSPAKWNDEHRIEHICDYYDELQYNYDYFYNKSQSQSDVNVIDNNNKPTKNVYQYSQLTKLRKNILNRRLTDHRQRLKSEKMMKENGEKSLVASLTSAVESMTIPSLHFHLILSLTMVLLSHQCPQYLLVL
jgi:hypothetical protein